MYDEKNIFAKILRQEIPCQKIYEDDYALAFHDIHPKAPVHILIIPKGSYINFSDFIEKSSTQEQSGFFAAVQKTITQTPETEKGYRILSNTGLNGGQEVPHFHLHLFAGKNLGPMIKTS